MVMGKVGGSDEVARKKTPAFFKVLIGGFKECLYLPPAFLPYISNEVIPCARIRAYDRRKWSVGLSRTDSYVSFEAGWKEFVEYYNLQLGEILVFKYLGHLRFTVKIFARSALERPYCSVPAAKTSRVTKQEVQARNGRTSISNRCNTTTLPIRQSFRPKRFYVQKEPLGMGRSTAERSNCDVEPSGKYKRRKSNDGEEFNKKDVCEPISAGDSSKPCNPSFKVVLKKMHDRKIGPPHITKEFCQTYLEAERDMISIYYANDKLKRMWMVKLYKKASGGIVMTTGFSRFCHENNLEPGDVCIFELNSDCSAFTVYSNKDATIT